MSMMHADVAVIGSELCGLAAGALLAHSHLRVTVILDDERDSLPLGERLVPRVPTLWRTPSSGPAAKLIEELGLKQEIRRALGEPVGIGLIDDPEIRMLVDIEPTRRERELKRVFGDAGAGVASALAGLTLDNRDALLMEATHQHEDGFFAKRREKRRLEEMGAAVDPSSTDQAVTAALDTPLNPALPYLLPFVQSADAAPIESLGGYLSLCALLAGTVVEAENGLGLRNTLMGLFHRVIQGHGGDVVEGAAVERVEGSGKKLTLVKTSGPNDYQVKVVIDGTEGRTLTDRLPDSRARAKTKALEDSVPPVSGAAIVRWLLPRDYVPRGLPPRALVLPEEAGAPGGGLLALFEELPNLEGRRVKGDDDLVAAVIAHWSRHEADAATADALERRLEQLFPFARDHIVARDRSVGADAWRALPTYQVEASSEHPLGGRRPRTGYANLFRAGRDLVPRLGLAGELAAARSVAGAALKAAGKKQGAD
jgi:phytoene dehydrogenase-like protein